MKTLRAALGCAVVVGVMLVGTSSAVAADAYWSPAGPTVESGSLQLSVNGGSTITCQINAAGTASGVWFAVPGSVSAPCSNGRTFKMSFIQGGRVNSGQYSVTFVPGIPTYSAFGGTFTPLNGFFVPFTNGSASTPSRITFNNHYIGSNQNPSGPVTATGTLDVTTASGGLVTLN